MKALDMLKFPLTPKVKRLRTAGHPIRLAGQNGKRLRIKSGPQKKG
jgi:hypothetical protein